MRGFYGNVYYETPADFSERIKVLEIKVNDLEYVPISIPTFTISPNIKPVGEIAKDVILNWKLNKLPASFVLTAPNGEVLVNGASGMQGSYTHSNANLRAAKRGDLKTYKIVVADKGSATVPATTISKTAGLTFVGTIYYGTTGTGEVTKEMLKNGSSKNQNNHTGSFTTTPKDEYVYYACPNDMTAPKFTMGPVEVDFKKQASITFYTASELGWTKDYVYDIYISPEKYKEEITFIAN